MNAILYFCRQIISMRQPFFAFLGLGILLLSLLFTYCTDPTLVGADLLDEDRAQTSFVDTFTVKSRTVLRDSTLTFTPSAGSQLQYYALGTFSDPFFGKVQADVYFQPRLSKVEPQLTTNICDSLILVIPVDTTTLNKNAKGKTFKLEIRRLVEDLPRTDLYSDQTFASDLLQTVDYTFTTDSLSVITYSSLGKDTIAFPHIRISLGKELGQELLTLDPSRYFNDSIFTQEFKGLHIRPVGEQPAMMSLNLTSARAGMYAYYRSADNKDTLQYQYDLDPGSVKMVHFSNDRANAPIMQAINGDNTKQYVSGFTGTDVEISFPYIQNLTGTSINKAELTVYRSSLEPDNDALFPPSSQLLLYYINSEGNLVTITDLSYALDPLRQLDVFTVFGGFRIQNTSGIPDRYVINLSAHVQRMLRKDVPPVVYLSTARKAEFPNRMAIHGANTGQYRISLALAFTKL